MALPKAINEHGEVVLIRQPWMQAVMNQTYHFVAIAAIARGSIQGAWEYEISEHLKRLYKNAVNRHIIEELLEETGAAGKNDQFDKAGYLITRSKIMEPAST